MASDNEFRIRSGLLKDFIKEITYRNRNPRNTKALELIEDFSTNPETLILKGCQLYRARIIKSGSSIKVENGFYGFGSKDSFIPDKKKTRDMRANYRYIPYLYCATSRYIALAEVRPRLGAKVSIATILVNEDIRLLDFTNKNMPTKMTQTKVNLFNDISLLFSKPIAEDDDISDYIPTQFIAEYAKNLGYDGIAFKSSVVPEINKTHPEQFNVVVFNHKKCEPIKSNVYTPSANYFDCIQIDDAPVRTPIKSLPSMQINEIRNKLKEI